MKSPPSAGDQLDKIIWPTWMTLQNVIVLPVAISLYSGKNNFNLKIM